MYGIGKLMQEYLEYVEMDNLWSRITTAEDLFIRLYTNYSNYSNKEKGGRIERSYDNDDLRNYKYRGFDLIRFRQNLSSKEEDSKKFNAKLIRDLYYKDSKDNSVFSNEKIFDKFNSTDSETKGIYSYEFGTSEIVRSKILRYICSVLES